LLFDLLPEDFLEVDFFEEDFLEDLLFELLFFDDEEDFFCFFFLDCDCAHTSTVESKDSVTTGVISTTHSRRVISRRISKILKILEYSPHASTMSA
jgi:hypothetical protein